MASKPNYPMDIMVLIKDHEFKLHTMEEDAIDLGTWLDMFLEVANLQMTGGHYTKFEVWTILFMGLKSINFYLIARLKYIYRTKSIGVLNLLNHGLTWIRHAIMHPVRCLQAYKKTTDREALKELQGICLYERDVCGSLMIPIDYIHGSYEDKAEMMNLVCLPYVADVRKGQIPPYLFLDEIFHYASKLGFSSLETVFLTIPVVPESIPAFFDLMRRRSKVRNNLTDPCLFNSLDMLRVDVFTVVEKELVIIGYKKEKDDREMSKLLETMALV